MKDRPPEDKNDLPSLVKQAWLLVAGFLGAVSLIYNFYKLWQGDQETITLITVAAGACLWLTALAWVGFSRVAPKTKGHAGKRSSPGAPRYSRFHWIARVALAVSLVAIGGGAFLLQKQRAALADKIVVVIAAFDGPEEEYGLRNQIIEDLNLALTGSDEIVILPIQGKITPSEGSSQARAIGARYQADIVLWGWYRPTENPNITLHIENLSAKELDVLKDTNVFKPKASLADLQSFSFQQQIGQETSGLIKFLAGYFQYTAENYQAALVHFDQVLAQPGWVGELGIQKIDVLFFRGHCHTFLDQHEQAIEDYTQVIQIDPLDACIYCAYNNRGANYFDLGHYDQALSDYNQAIQIDPQRALAYTNRGILYQKLDEHEKAIADFKQALQADPADINAYLNLGDVYISIDKKEQALDTYTQAIKADPQSVNAYIKRGVLYISLGKPDLGIEDFNQAIKIDPLSVDAYNNRGAAYIGLEQYDKALADINQALKINPQFARAYGNRGNIYGKLGNYEQALQDLNQAIAIDPEIPEIYVNRGNAYAFIGQYDLAISDLTKALTMNPKIAQAYYNRGLIYQKIGLEKDADADFQKYTNLTGQPAP